MLTLQHLLALLQLSSPVFVKDRDDKVYCRELFCVFGNNSRNEPLPNNYYICPPASNFDCKLVDFKERTVEMVKCEEGMMWTGVGAEKVNARLPLMKGDRLAIRFSQLIPEEWKSDVCSITGAFGTKRCQEIGEPTTIKVQVVNVGGQWVALKPFQIIESPKPEAKVCWSTTGWVKDCPSSSDMNCFCVMDTVEELIVERNGVRLLVDAVGVRDIVSHRRKPTYEVSECSLKRVENQWIVMSQVDLNGRIALVRKGEEMVKCVVEESKLCYKPQWMFKSGEILASFYMNGQIISQCSVFEAVSDACSAYGITERWRKYQCWGLIEHTLVFISITMMLALTASVIIILSFMFSSLRRACYLCFKTTKVVGKATCVAGRIARSVVKRGFQKAATRIMENYEELPVTNVYRPGNGNSVKEKLKRGIVFTMVASSGLPKVRGACSNLELSAFKTTCADKSCVISESMRLILPAGTSTMCIKPREEQLSELEFELKASNFRLECVAFDEYWTGDYEADSCSKFECSGLCPSQEEAWRKLTECGAKEGDYTIKTAAPGCVTNGCWSCSTSCMLIYPYFKMRKDEVAVKVFRCKEWLPEVTIDVVKRENGLLSVYQENIFLNSMSTIGPFKIRWLQMSLTPNHAYSEHFLMNGNAVCMISAAVKGNIDPKKVGYVQCNSKRAAESLMPSSCLFDTRDISCSTGSKNEVQCTMLKPSWRELCEKRWLPLESGSSVLVAETNKVFLNVDNFGSMEFGLEMAEPMTVDVVEPKSSCVIAEAKISGCYNCEEKANLKILSESKNGKPSVFVKCENGIHPFTFTCEDIIVKVSAFVSEIDTECLAMIGFSKTKFKVHGSLRPQVHLPSMKKTGGMGFVSGPDSELPSWSEIKWKFIAPAVGLTFMIGLLILLFKCGVLSSIAGVCVTKAKRG